MADVLTLDSIRESLIRQEDSIIFALIERAKHPINPPLYAQDYFPAFSPSLIDCFVKQSEQLQSKLGRYESSEENPFFPDNLPPSLVPTHSHPQVLHPAGASINIHQKIWDMYYKELLPLVAADGDDGNYAQTAASDLNCLQVLSRRIHYGKFVAEVKFRDSPEDYEPAIRSKDEDALMKLLTFESVEEMVKKRVVKKTMAFAQGVTLNDDDDKKGTYKIDPLIMSRLYEEWVMPLTKFVQVEYLLRRLD